MKRIQRGGILRERYGERDIVFLRVRGEFLRPNIFQKRCAETAAEALPRERHNRHTHVECVTGRAAARIGEGVERNIHPCIGGKIIGRRSLRIDAHKGNPCRLDASERLPAAVRIGEHIRLEQEAALRHAPQNLRPYGKHAVIQLRKVVEAPKDNAAPRCGRMRGNGSRMQRLPAKM